MASFCKLNPKKKWVEQPDSDKLFSYTDLEWPSQSPDPNPTEITWKDLRQVHVNKPANMQR